jgi:perosamine synthetase
MHNDTSKIDQPIRDKAFEPTCYLSGNEIELVTRCLESKNWSSFKGGTEGWALDDCAYMPSEEAAKFEATAIRFLGGEYVRKLEADVARDTDVTFAISANSATSALVMALGAINLEPGDEVIVPCLSFNASATAILFFNAAPVFCEVKPDTLCIDPIDIERKITENTKAIVVVHFAGNSADMDAIMALAEKHSLRVIEDTAQAPGARYGDRALGSIGDAGIFSFTETKNISCGEGGMVTTNDPKIAKKCRLIRNHGEGMTDESWSDEELANIIGMNFRLTELQAAVAIPQWESLRHRNAIRNENWDILVSQLTSYSNSLTPISSEVNSDPVRHIAYWHWDQDATGISRTELIKAMQETGIPIGPAYGRLMHENPLYTRKIAFGTQGCPWTCKPISDIALRTYGTGACPTTEKINSNIVSFKFINPPNTADDMDDVVRAFRKVIG